MTATYTDFDRQRFGECLLLNLPFSASAENGVRTGESFTTSMRIRRPSFRWKYTKSQRRSARSATTPYLILIMFCWAALPLSHLPLFLHKANMVCDIPLHGFPITSKCKGRWLSSTSLFRPTIAPGCRCRGMTWSLKIFISAKNQTLLTKVRLELRE